MRSNRIAICLTLTISLCTAQANKPKQAASEETNAPGEKIAACILFADRCQGR